MKLDTIIKSFLNELGEEGAHKYVPLLRIARDGLEELNIDIAGTTSVTELTMNWDLLTAPLPSDYISYKRIGVCVGGQVIPLGYNPKLCLNKTFDDCGNLIRSIPTCNCTGDTHWDNCSGGFPYGFPYFGGYDSAALHYRNGHVYGAYFGLGGGQNAWGYYRIDENNWQIQFCSVVNAPVVLEYLADVKKVGGEFIVHPYLSETLKAFIAWAYIRNKRGISANEIARKRTEYYNQRRLSSRRFTAFTLDEAYQYGRKSTMQAPKL